MGRTITIPTPNHPYDDGIYQADTRYAPTALAVDNLPPMCGQIAPVGETTRCLRLIRTMHLHTDTAEINRNIASITRMRNDWKARNLIGWVEFATRRLNFQHTTWDLPECTCGDRALPTPTHDLEQVYPACTC